MMRRLRADWVRWFPGYGTGAAASSLAALRLFGVLQFNYDPTRDLQRIKVPVLVVMGERDLVFPPALVVDRMRSALARGGNTRVDIAAIPGASHGLMIPQTVADTAFRHSINPAFLGTVVDWVALPAGAAR